MDSAPRTHERTAARAREDELDRSCREQREEYERKIDRNDRLLGLARHNGFDLNLSQPREDLGGKRLWIVPEILQPMCGAMGLLVR